MSGASGAIAARSARTAAVGWTDPPAVDREGGRCDGSIVMAQGQQLDERGLERPDRRVERDVLDGRAGDEPSIREAEHDGRRASPVWNVGAPAGRDERVGDIARDARVRDRQVGPGDGTCDDPGLPKVGRAERPRIEVRHREGVALRVDQGEVAREGELRDRLSAVAAGPRFARRQDREGGVSRERAQAHESFTVERLRQVHAGELDVTAEDQVAGAGLQADRPHEEPRDRRDGELRRGRQGQEHDVARTVEAELVDQAVDARSRDDRALGDVPGEPLREGGADRLGQSRDPSGDRLVGWERTATHAELAGWLTAGHRRSAPASAGTRRSCSGP